MSSREAGSQQLLDHFALNEPPFADWPSAAFVYAEVGQRDALEAVLGALASGRGLIKVVGEPGSGKTLLCRGVLQRLADTASVVYLPAPCSSSRELHRVIARELGLELPADAALHEGLKRIAGRLLQLRRARRPVVVLLDEAQSLPVDALAGVRLLDNLETGSGKLIQIVLVGQPALDDTLALPALYGLHQRISAGYRFRRMDRESVRGYLTYRLGVAGCARRDVFSAAAIGALHRGSRGVPRLVSRLAHDALVRTAQAGQAQVRWRQVRLAIRELRSLQRALPLRRRGSRPERGAVRARVPRLPRLRGDRALPSAVSSPPWAVRSRSRGRAAASSGPRGAAVARPRLEVRLAAASRVLTVSALAGVILAAWGLGTSRFGSDDLRHWLAAAPPSVDPVPAAPVVLEEALRILDLAMLPDPRAVREPDVAAGNAVLEPLPVEARAEAPARERPAPERDVVAAEPFFEKTARAPSPLHATRRAYRAALADLEDGREGDALASLRAVLELDPRFHPAREALASVLARQGRLEEAESVIDLGRRLDPAYPAFAMWKARCLAIRGALPEALEVLERLSEPLARDPEFHGLTAAVHQRRGEHARALAHYQQALRGRSDRASWWVGLGISLERVSRSQDALEAYRAASVLGGLGSESLRFVGERIRALETDAS